MKTEDLKNYIFEQCLTEKTHPLVMRGAQWVVDQIGGDPKKIASKMTRGINKTAKEPTPEHVYNAAQFHFGEILRKNSPSMDRPEIYADMRKRLRAHLGLGEVNETSDAAAKNLEYARFNQGQRASSTSDDIHKLMMKKYQKTGRLDPALIATRDIFSKEMLNRFASATKAGNRRRGYKGDGSPRTSTQESAFNFINGLKRLQENSRRRKDAIPGKRTTRIQNYSDKMYPMPDDANEFDTGQIESQRAEADRALGRRENPHDFKKYLRHVRIF